MAQSLKNPLALRETYKHVQLGYRNFRCCCSVAQSRRTLSDPMDCSTPGISVPHYLRTFVQGHVHRIGHAIQPSHPLMPSFPSALNLSQHQGLSQ